MDQHAHFPLSSTKLPTLRAPQLIWEYTGVPPLYIQTGVNFINILLARFLYKSLCAALFLLTILLCNFWHQNFVQKMRTQNVDEIDPRSIIEEDWAWGFCDEYECSLNSSATSLILINY
jgi:hypothetical protein